MNTASPMTSPLPAPCPPLSCVPPQAPRAWLVGFVPISHDDPALRVILQRLQWALDMEKQR